MLCHDPPYSGEISPTFPMKGPRNKSHFNIFHEIRVVGDGDAHDYK